MSRFALTPTAEKDLTDIIEFIARDSPDAALRVRNEIYDAFTRLATAPGIGHFRFDLLGRQYKFWSVYSYVIVYRWKSKPLQIISVLHGARNLGAVLRRRKR